MVRRRYAGVSTYVWLNRTFPLADSGMFAKKRPVQRPVCQYVRDRFHMKRNSLLPLGSTVSMNIPGSGSWAFRHDVSTWYSPVSLFSPTHAPDMCVSVGCSKLCHNTLEVFEPGDGEKDNDDDKFEDHTTNELEVAVVSGHPELGGGDSR